MADKVISTHTESTAWSGSTEAWFLWQSSNSTYYKTELKSAFDLKANVTQSSWINVTYSSNWVNYSTVYPPTSYYKDTLGNVHFRLHAKDGTSNPVCNLPSGYIPEYQINFPIYCIPASSAIPTMYITSTGGVNVAGHTTARVHLGEVVFTPST